MFDWLLNAGQDNARRKFSHGGPYSEVRRATFLVKFVASHCISSAALNGFFFVRFLSSSICINSPPYLPTATFTSNWQGRERALPRLEARCHLQRLKKKERKRKRTSAPPMTTKLNQTKQNQAEIYTWTIGRYTQVSRVLNYFRSLSGSWLLRLIQCVKIYGSIYPHDIDAFPKVFMHNKKFK